MVENQPYVLVEITPPVAKLTLNKPDRLNAFTLDDRAELSRRLVELKDDDSVRVLILTGAGRGFCSGSDVSNMPLGPTIGRTLRERYFEPIGGFISDVYAFDKPLIAAINGAAAGAGMSLALACDVRIASSNARFTPAWIDRGLVPDGGASYFLPRMLGVTMATELALLGEPIDARRAYELGLVSRVVEQAELLDAAMGVAQKIASKPPIAVHHIKQNMRMGVDHSLDRQLLMESSAQRLCLLTEDVHEARQAFLEKRPPSYKGR